jgi:hypothetical protein
MPPHVVDRSDDQSNACVDGVNRRCPNCFGEQSPSDRTETNAAAHRRGCESRSIRVVCEPSTASDRALALACVAWMPLSRGSCSLVKETLAVWATVCRCGSDLPMRAMAGSYHRYAGLEFGSSLISRSLSARCSSNPVKSRAFNIVAYPGPLLCDIRWRRRNVPTYQRVAAATCVGTAANRPGTFGSSLAMKCRNTGGDWVMRIPPMRSRFA